MHNVSPQIDRQIDRLKALDQLCTPRRVNHADVRGWVAVGLRGEDPRCVLSRLETPAWGLAHRSRCGDVLPECCPANIPQSYGKFRV